MASFLKGQRMGAVSTWLEFSPLTAEIRRQEGNLLSPSARPEAPHGGLMLWESAGARRWGVQKN